MDLAVLLTGNTDQNPTMTSVEAFYHMHPFTSPGATSDEAASIFDEYAANARFRELQGELRSLLFTGAYSTAPTREQSPDDGERQPPSTSRCQPGHRLLLQQLRSSQDQIPLMTKVKYLNNWVSECAPWLDMFDQDRAFGVQVPILAQKFPTVFDAMLALSARQIERRSGARDSYDSLKLYSGAISSLAPILSPREPAVLVTACILCVLEMMSVRPHDWRRHVEGCAALFEASGVHGFSGGLFQAIFWCFARMDLCGAIIANGTESTVLAVERWVHLDLVTEEAEAHGSWARRMISKTFLAKGQQVADMHANYAVYLCAKVYDLLAKRTHYVELGKDNGCDDATFRDMWNEIWNDLQEWYTYRPQKMLPIQEIAANPPSLHFPRILFTHWAAISANQLYHTACIVMLEINPDDQGSARDLAIYAPLWHARRIVGISTTNPHRGCLNNAVQPLWVAGKLFTHRDEQEIIVKVIDEIEACSGWGARWRIRDLENAWGYAHGTFRQARGAP